MAIIKTAILQTHVYTDKFRNITQAAELLASPELQGIDLAVLPEMFCCPYENKYFPEYAETEGGEMCIRDSFQKAYLDTDYEEDEEVKIIRTKKFGIKPMYPEDACVQMELLGHNFFVFFNAETEQVNVVYKRKGNTYGLIEPEF